MIREIVAYAFVIGIVLAIAAVCFDAFCRAVGRPTRWIWLAALGGTAVLVTIAPARQARGGGYYGAVRVLDGTSATPLAARSGSLEVARKILTIATQPLIDALVLARRIPARADTWIITSWLLAATLVLLVLLSTYARWRAATRRCPSADVHGVRVRVAPAMGPAAVGIVAPEVIVPRWLLDTPPDQQRLALAHEVEHLRAHDPLLLIAGFLPAVLLPWHPAVWWMLSRLRLAVEMDCDARVLRRGTSDAGGYGATLIDLAQRCGATRLGAVALAEGSTHLERRLRAMTTRHSRFARVRTSIVSAIALVGLVGACEARLPTQADVDTVNARSAEKIAKDAMLAGGAPVYEVDGNAVSRDSALRVKPADIATVNVRKGDKVSTITIRTNKMRGAGDVVRRVTPSDTIMSTKALGKFSGLMVIDGRKVAPSELAFINPKDIVSVEVLKNEAAVKAYSDPAVANGVIVVTTVRAAEKARQ